jgi:hypothetical protein
MNALFPCPGIGRFERSDCLAYIGTGSGLGGIMSEVIPGSGSGFSEGSMSGSDPGWRSGSGIGGPGGVFWRGRGISPMLNALITGGNSASSHANGKGRIPDPLLRTAANKPVSRA